MSIILKSIVDLLIPKRCFCCGSFTEKPVCSVCHSSFNFITAEHCLKCGHPTLQRVKNCRQCRGKRNHFEIARSLFVYEGKAKEAILSLKLESAFALADFFAKEAIERFNGDYFDIQALTYIPISFSKKIRRPHNSSEILARSMSHYLDIPVFDMLAYDKRVADQAGLDHDERKDNLRGAFRIKGGLETVERIMVVDDVFTTGSTVNEACRVISDKGSKVRVLTAARTIY